MIGTIDDLCARLKISRPTAVKICERKGSPAWRLSDRPKSPWRVDLEQMENFLRGGTHGK